MLNPSAIFFGGSRSLGACSSLAPLVSAVQSAGLAVHVGCCVGADAQVIAAALPSFLVVFAAFAQGGAGAWSGSAVGPVLAAAQAGASVRWLAGGPLSVPLRVRLIRRSVAAFSGCSAAVFFSPGPGSLAVAARAVRHMLIYSVGACPAPIPGRAGRWVTAQFFGFPCWLWLSSQAALL